MYELVNLHLKCFCEKNNNVLQGLESDIFSTPYKNNNLQVYVIFSSVCRIDFINNWFVQKSLLVIAFEWFF